MLTVLFQRLKATAKSGCHRISDTRFFLCSPRYLFLISSLLVLGGVAEAARLVTAPELARAGAPGLALSLLEEQQPSYDEQPDKWMQWQRLRIRVLEETKQWTRMETSLSDLPPELPADFRGWLMRKRARAVLEQGRPREAREQLLTLVWGGDVQDEELKLLRHLIIRSYLEEGRQNDAYAATLRFRHDYGEGDQSAILLRVRVFLSSGRAGEAKAALASLKGDPEASALSLLADLRQGSDSKEIIKQVKHQLKEKDIDDSARQLLWAVYAEAARLGGDMPGEVIALEQILARQRSQSLPGELFSIEPDELWLAYHNYAVKVGNIDQLLFGDDEAWFKSAETAGRKYPVKRRSLYALLAQRATKGEDRREAHRKLGDAWLEQEDGLEILHRLYLGSSRFTLAAVPPEVRYRLADRAIAEGDLELASRLLQTLEEAPEGGDLFIWQLRRVKVFLLAGDYPKSEEVMHEILAGSPSLEPKQVDRLIQLIFDLQTVGQNESAYQLLRELYLRSDDPKARRELLYWMADSRLAQEHYLEAGRLYLQSAIVTGPMSMDPWAQTARYQAAKALAKGGLIDDARRLYQQLLRVTNDPARRAVVIRDLEQLHLIDKQHEPSSK